MTYRRRYMSRVQTPPVLDLLLVDRDNPRSLAFQLGEISAGITALPQSSSLVVSSIEHEFIGRALRRLDQVDVEQLAEVDTHDRRSRLDLFITELEIELPSISEALSRTYLTHLQAARQYASA